MQVPVTETPPVDKPWGTTACLFRSEATEIHLIKPRRGGYCSIHEHRSKTNLFYVVSGRLRLTVSTPVSTIAIDLTAGMHYAVPPCWRHRFEALEDTIALEIYSVCVNPDDIVRYSHGGCIGTKEAPSTRV